MTALARAAAEAYRSNPGTVLPGGRVYAVSRGAIQCHIDRNDEDLIVAFRGTEPRALGDIWTDLRIGRVSAPGLPGRWHFGFHAGLRRVSLWLIAALLRAPRAQRVWLVGHSLGGALAALLAAELAFHGEEHIVAGIYTFGAPRYCNGPAARWMEVVFGDRLVRVVIRGDRVPRLPPAVFGYRHAGRVWEVGRALGAFRAHSLARYRRLVRRCTTTPSCTQLSQTALHGVC